MLIPLVFCDLSEARSIVGHRFHLCTRSPFIGMCDEISALMSSRYNIGKVELTVSFNAGGEFIGFGAGGAASIKITIIPSK